MGLVANISLVVPDLPDNDVAFANAAAWKNYWKNIQISTEFDAAVNAIYAETPYDNTLQEIDLLFDGIQYRLPSLAQFNSLLVAYQNLNTNYKNLRQALKDAGIIVQSS